MRRPRIVVIGGSYRALCVLEHLLDRGERVVAFIGQEGDAERDFCSEILEVCNRGSVPARSARKLGEEIVRWLDDRIRPDLAITVGMSTQIPLSIGGNCRLGLLEIIDCFLSKSVEGVVLRQRGQVVEQTSVPEDGDEEEATDRYLRMVDAILETLDRYLNRLAPTGSPMEVTVPFRAPVELSSVETAHERAAPGPETTALETELAAYVGAHHALAICSVGTAYDLLWEALELAPEQEVICPAVVSVASVASIRRRGARPVFVDVEPGRLTLDPDRLDAVRSPGTRAVVIGHPFGQPAALDRLYAWAEAAGVEVLEDAGGSLGARFAEGRLGGHPCTCIFRAAVAASAAPALVTLSPALAERLGAAAARHRLGDGPAAATRRWLAGLEHELAQRRRNASEYSANLVRYDAFEVPPTPLDALPVYSSYLLRVTRHSRTGPEDLCKLLAESGIETRSLRLPLRERDLATLPVADSAAVSGIFLPVGSHVDDLQREHVLDTLYSYGIG
ncbi:MAG: DegT/DnrJ/EryC1/StrS family aminotransferase [Myxococcota bacterium]